MSTVPSHEEIQSLLPAAALGSLSELDHTYVVVHVSQCADCAKILADYQEVVATLALSLPERTFEPDRHQAVRARLLTRVRASHQAGGAGRPRQRANPRPPLGTLVRRWSGWAVAGGLAGVLLMHHAVHRPVDYGWLVAGVLSVAFVALVVLLSVQRGRIAALQARVHVLEEGAPANDQEVVSTSDP